MLTDYIRAAMRRAKYGILEDDHSFWGDISGLDGVWANEETLEGCREELESTLEDWILVGLWLHHDIPILDGIDLNPKIPNVA